MCAFWTLCPVNFKKSKFLSGTLLWNTYLPHLYEDFRTADKVAEQRALAHLSELLAIHGKKLSDFNLPELDRSILIAAWLQEDEYDIVNERECANDAIAAFNE